MGLVKTVILIGLILFVAVHYGPYIRELYDYSQLPDDTIISVMGGNGSLILKNGTMIELPTEIRINYDEQSLKEFMFAMEERGIETYEDFKQYNNMIWSGHEKWERDVNEYIKQNDIGQC